MGLTDSKQIIARIENEYKSLRKYCDPVYGEITVIQHKTSRRQYALIEKPFLKANGALAQFLAININENYLLKLEKYDVCDMSLCSDIRLYFFLFQYTPHTLEQEVAKRLQDANPFTREQAMRIFYQQLEITFILRERVNPETGKAYKFLLTNNSFLCSPVLDLRILEPVFRNDPEYIDQYQKCYLSPEAYKALQRGENYGMRQICNRQPSLVFTMALNFIECLLLADISQIYQDCTGQQVINYRKLHIACEQILQTYGEDLYIMLIKMTHPDQNNRPSLLEIKSMIKKPKNGRFSIHRVDKQSLSQMPQKRKNSLSKIPFVINL